MDKVEKYGCEHYKRKCALIVRECYINVNLLISGYVSNVLSILCISNSLFLSQAPCCNKTYTCRVCHDDKENHELTRKKVMQVHCLTCKRVQQVSKRVK